MKLYTIPAITILYATNSVSGGVNIEACNQIISHELFNKNRLIKLDNKEIELGELCSEYKKLTNTSGGLNYKFVGLNAKDSKEEASKVCSVNKRNEKYLELTKDFSTIFSDNLRSVYKTCIDSIRKDPSRIITSSNITWTQGDPNEKGNGKNIPHYSVSLSFRWIPYNTSSKTDIWVENIPANNVDCSFDGNVGTPNTDIFKRESNNEITPNEQHSFSCQVIKSMTPSTLKIHFSKAEPIILSFPKKSN